jgi:ankyrin repeat protein
MNRIVLKLTVNTYAELSQTVSVLTKPDSIYNAISQDWISKMYSILPKENSPQVENLASTLSTELDKDLADMEKIQSLIRKGAPVNTQGKKTGWTAVHVAAQRNNMALMKWLVENQRADVNLKTSNSQRTPLFYTKNNSEMIQYLIQKGADLSQRDNTGKSVIRELAENSKENATLLLKALLEKSPANIDQIWTLISLGANPTTHNNLGQTAVHIAVMNNNSDLVNYMSLRNTNVMNQDVMNQADYSQRTPLLYAYNSPEMIESLLTFGAKLDDKTLDTLTKDAPGNASAILKIELGKGELADIERIKYLLKRGADRHSKGEHGQTVDSIAIRKNDTSLITQLEKEKAAFTTALSAELDKKGEANLETIQSLIGKGAPVNTQGKGTGWTAVHVAAQQNNMDLMKWLVENKSADVNLKTSSTQRTPLFYAKGKDEMIKYLIQKGADLSQKDCAGNSVIGELTGNSKEKATFLLKAALEQLPENMEEIGNLIKQGAAPNTQSDSGVTAAHIAVKRNNSQLLTQLANKADFNIPDRRGSTPVFYATDPQMVDFLIELGADLNHENKAGEKAVHIAVRYNNRDLVRHLCLKGTDLADSSQPNILLYAYKNPEMIELLLKSGANLDDNTLNILTENVPQNATAILKIELEKEKSANIERIKYLLERGANVTTRTILGYTVGHIAAMQNDLKMLERLPKSMLTDILKFELENGCKANMELINCLITQEADVTARASFGRTVAHIAAMQNDLKTLERLPTNVLTARNKAGQTPLEVASKTKNKNQEVIAFLKTKTPSDQNAGQRRQQRIQGMNRFEGMNRFDWMRGENSKPKFEPQKKEEEEEKKKVKRFSR